MENTTLAAGINRTLKNVASKLPRPLRPKKDEIEFVSNGVLTLGVEIELQLIDPQTCNLAQRAEELLKASSHLKNVKPELHLSTVEINTDICANVQDVERDLRATMDGLDIITDQLGIELAATAVHPIAKYSDSIIFPNERYLDLIDRNQWLTRRLNIFGVHVHIGMRSGDESIYFNNFFINFLPHLLALSASSPFWQGADTGLSSCRATAYEALPTAGQPYPVRNWKDFENLYETLKKCGSIKQLKDLWWDLRPSPGYGTLELRISDGCSTLYETLAIVAFIHSLAHWFADHGSWYEFGHYPPVWILRENKWRAMRHGLDAELVMNIDGKTRPMREDIREWVEKLKPYAKKLGYQEYLADLLMLVERGPSADRQRAVFKQTGKLEDVVKLNVREYRNRKPEWA
ncbi:MAG TPA: YbdK family carboxylate-amine ligase [Rickettsiales bacterium]|nr:YbdK family carboxylate-amine ligase [Rickettsiales bacterium]